MCARLLDCAGVAGVLRTPEELDDVIPVRSSDPCGKYTVPLRLYGTRHSLAEIAHRRCDHLSDSVLLRSSRTDDGCDLLELGVCSTEPLLDRPPVPRACADGIERRRTEAVRTCLSDDVP